MPDRNQVINSPEDGMFILYSSHRTNWVLLLKNVSYAQQKLEYRYQMGVSTIEEIRNGGWSIKQFYTFDDWKAWLAASAGEVRILPVFPDWEV